MYFPRFNRNSKKKIANVKINRKKTAEKKAYCTSDRENSDTRKCYETNFRAGVEESERELPMMALSVWALPQPTIPQQKKEWSVNAKLSAFFLSPLLLLLLLLHDPRCLNTYFVVGIIVSCCLHVPKSCTRRLLTRLRAS